MAYQLPEFGILALSMMIVIITGGINLSVTYTATLSMIIGGYVMSQMYSAGSSPVLSVITGITLMLIVSIACGAFNGFVIAYIGVTPFLATLGAMTLFEGISLKITKGGAVSGFPMDFIMIGNSTFLGIPIPMIIFLIVLVFTYLLLERSKTGTTLYMIGSNAKVSLFSGITVRRNLFFTYVFASFLAGIAGILMASRYNSAKESYGSSYLLQSISAAVLGGTSIYGGEGKVAGTVIAVMIIQVISSGLNIIGLNKYLTNVVMGLILVIVLTINYLTRKK
jgi:simple sugar transport system permease protein